MKKRIISIFLTLSICICSITPINAQGESNDSGHVPKDICTMETIDNIGIVEDDPTLDTLEYALELDDDYISEDLSDEEELISLENTYYWQGCPIKYINTAIKHPYYDYGNGEYSGFFIWDYGKYNNTYRVMFFYDNFTLQINSGSMGENGYFCLIQIDKTTLECTDLLKGYSYTEYMEWKNYFFTGVNSRLISDSDTLFVTSSTGTELKVEQFGGHYYKCFYDDVTWKEAKQFCEELGGYLAVVTSEEEHSFIYSISVQRYIMDYWLGGTCEGSDGVWRWVNGEPWDYTNWDEGQPDNHYLDEGEHYLQIWRETGTGKWNDSSNVNYTRNMYKDPGGFICEWDSDPGNPQDPYVPKDPIDYSNATFHVYSDLPFTEIAIDQRLSICPVLCIEDNILDHEYEWIFMLEETGIAEISNLDAGITLYGPLVELKGIHPGSTSLKAVHTPSGRSFSIPISVVDNKTRTIHIGDLVKDPLKEYVSSGLMLTHFQQRAANGGRIIRFDAYNTLSYAAAVEVYDKDGTILQSEIIEKRKRYSDDTIEVFKSAAYLPVMIVELFQNNRDLTWACNSKETADIELFVPEEGYIIISNDASNSHLVALYNSIDIAIWAMFIFDKWEKNPTASETELIIDSAQQQIREKIKDKTLSEVLADEAKKSVYTSFQKEFVKIATKESLADGVVALLNLFEGKGPALLQGLELDLNEIIEKVLGKLALKTGESIFEEITGPVGEALEMIYKISDGFNYFMLLADLIKTANIGEIKIDMQDSGDMLYREDARIVANPDKETETILKKKEESEEIIRRANEFFGHTDYIITQASAYELEAKRNGITAELKEPVTIDFSLPFGYSPETTEIYLFANDGTTKKIDVDCSDGRFVFDSSVTGTFLIIENGQKSSTDPSQDKKWNDILLQDREGVESVEEIKDGIWIAGVTDMAYTGKNLSQDIRVYDGNIMLTSGTDYSIKYKNNKNIYTIVDPKNISALDKKSAPQMLISMKGNYSGKETVYFSINATGSDPDKLKTEPYLITGDKITITDILGNEALSAAYDKNGAKPFLRIMYEDTILKEGRDYTLKYLGNTKYPATKASVTVIGKGRFSGKKTLPFSIAQRTFSTASGITVVATDKAEGMKSGQYKTNVKVFDSEGKLLKAGTDYEKTIIYLKDGVELTKTDYPKAGDEITVRVTGKGGYTNDSIETTYNIVSAGQVNDISKATIKIKNQSYNKGKAITITDQSMFSQACIGKNKTPLTLSTDGGVTGNFMVVPGSYSKNTNKGTAKVTFMGINGYTGTKTVRFSIDSRSLKDNWLGWIR